MSQAVTRLRRECHEKQPAYFYVTDEAGRLVGVVPVRSLLLSDPATFVAELMVHPVYSVPESATFGSALALLAEQRLFALPVVDESGRLTGILNISGITRAVVDQEQQRAKDETFQMTGLRPLDGPRTGFDLVLVDRLPWILVSLAAGLSCALLLNLFAATLKDAMAIAFFVPLVICIGERIAFQAAIPGLLRNLRAGRGQDGQSSRNRRADVFLAVAGIALIVCSLALGWLGFTRVAGAALCSILSAGGAGLGAGYAIPRLMRRWHLERTVASAPVVLAVTDIAALSCYLSLCGIFVR